MGDLSSRRPRNLSNRPTKYKTHYQNATRINISMSHLLIDEIDKVAEAEYTTRSDIIRMAVLWYIRPQGRDHLSTSPEQILRTLQRRLLMMQSNKQKVDGEFDNLDVYDG